MINELKQQSKSLQKEELLCETLKDAIVEEVRQDLHNRSQVGNKKVRCNFREG